MNQDSKLSSKIKAQITRFASRLSQLAAPFLKKLLRLSAIVVHWMQEVQRAVQPSLNCTTGISHR